MNLFAYAVLLGWVPLALLLFATLRPLLAVLTVLVAGFLFLPICSLHVVGSLEYGKAEAISLSLLLGVLLFDSRRLKQLRLKLLDIPLFVVLVAGPISAITNDHGVVYAASIFVYRVVLTGIPYLVGALYLRTAEALRLTLWVVFLSGLVYVPLCLYEVRMSPQLHRIFYGAAQHDFVQTMRGGGYRPMVFMYHGLELSLWMAVATLAGVGLWRHLSVRQVAGVRMAWLVGALCLTFVLCKSTGALLLCAIALLVMTPSLAGWPRKALLYAFPAYLGLRLLGVDTIEQWLIDGASWLSGERAGSLQYRFDNERLLLERFWQRPWFGLSSWGFNLLASTEEPSEVTVIVADSLWIVTLASNGLVGLVGFMGSLWIPAARALGVGIRAARSVAPELLTIGMILTVFLLNSLANGWCPGIYMAMAGGVVRVPRLRSPRSRVVDLGAAAPAGGLEVLTPSRGRAGFLAVRSRNVGNCGCGPSASLRPRFGGERCSK